ncbi:MAG: rtcR [Verrucomicrobiales bacterium]|nr:rtcR [Verrucomicrobiales bacterium]
MYRELSHPNTGSDAKPRPKVVIGLLGTKLDGIKHHDRWTTWRPSLCALLQKEWPVDRFELLFEEKFDPLASFVMEDMRGCSPHTEVRPHHVCLGDNPWDFESVYDGLATFAKSYPFDPDHEDYFIHITTGTHVAQICLFLLTETGQLPARLLQTGPNHRIVVAEKSVGRIDIIDLNLSRYDRMATRFSREQEEAQDFLRSGIPTKNAGFNTLIGMIERVALRSKEPMLLTGPTGAGKSQLARRICELRRQRCGLKGKFVEVNCATLRGDGAMSALFGHVKGAFTGAVADRAGVLREADGGLLFLDEIGELGLDEQAMLLRAVEDKCFSPHGSDKTVHSDFQLIAGTNRDLHELVACGRFREDLQARVNLWTFALPGLAERKEDIAPNVDYELERASARLGRKITMNREARQAFLRFAESPDATWQGNFRDLNAIMLRLATLAEKGRITEDLVHAETALLQAHWRKLARPDGRPGTEADDPAVLSTVLGRDFAERFDRFDLVQLAWVVRVCRTSRSMAEAGRRLFNVSREAKQKSSNDTDRVRKYLARFGLDWASVQPGSGDFP